MSRPYLGIPFSYIKQHHKFRRSAQQTRTEPLIFQTKREHSTVTLIKEPWFKYIRSRMNSVPLLESDNSDARVNHLH